MNRLAKICVLIFVGLCICRAEAADGDVSRPVSQCYAIETGGIHLEDSYLSPLHYSGTDISVSGMWGKIMRFNPNWVMNFEGRIGGKALQRPYGRSLILGFDGKYGWDMNCKFKLPYEIALFAGAGIDIDAGVLYLSQNSNNPVSINASTDIKSTVGASWHFCIGKLPILLEEKLSVPLIGMFFMPEYGESYYEIYLGNYKGLVHPGWWGNNFCLNNRFAISLDFGRTALQLYYRFNLSQARANHLRNKSYVNTFGIGIIPHGLGLKVRKPKQITKTINAWY